MAPFASPLSHSQPVSFAEWAGVLWRGPWSAETQKAYAREICAFLRHCRCERAPATILRAKAYIERAEPDSDEAANRERREALRWFFRAARDRGPPLRPAGTRAAIRRRRLRPRGTWAGANGNAL